MFGVVKTYWRLALSTLVVLAACLALIFVYRAGKNKQRIKNLEVENVQRQKAIQAEREVDHCVASRGLAHCVPDTFERKD